MSFSFVVPSFTSFRRKQSVTMLRLFLAGTLNGKIIHRIILLRSNWRPTKTRIPSRCSRFLFWCGLWGLEPCWGQWAYKKRFIIVFSEADARRVLQTLFAVVEQCRLQSNRRAFLHFVSAETVWLNKKCPPLPEACPFCPSDIFPAIGEISPKLCNYFHEKIIDFSYSEW